MDGHGSCRALCDEHWLCVSLHAFALTSRLGPRHACVDSTLLENRLCLQDTDVIVRVCDVYPDGRSILVVEYAQRARYRHGFEHQELLIPGAISPRTHLLF